MLPALELVDLNSQVMGEGAPTIRKLLPLAPGPLQCKRLEHGESSYLRLFAFSVSKNPI